MLFLASWRGPSLSRGEPWLWGMVAELPGDRHCGLGNHGGPSQVSQHPIDAMCGACRGHPLQGHERDVLGERGLVPMSQAMHVRV